MRLVGPTYLCSTLLISFALIPAPKKKGESYVRELLCKWNRLHAVRSIISSGALLALLAGWCH